MPVKKKTIKKKSYIGTNIRISDEGFEMIKTYCKRMGYKLGTFVENAAVNRILLESSKS
jgi:hypothetical protein